MRTYTKIDLLRFAKFAKDHADMPGIELLKAYDLEYPELTKEQKAINLARALGLEGIPPRTTTTATTQELRHW